MPTESPTKDNEEIRAEMAAELRRLRWLLTSCRMGGIRDWPSPPLIVEPGKPADLEEPGEPMEPAIAQPAPATVSPVEKPLPDADRSEALQLLSDKTLNCSKCRLCEGRRNAVFGEGSSHPQLVFVGEGPGFEEDQQGRPFVGKAGKLLDKMIRSIGMARQDVFICNVVKCRPPGNRTPGADEIDACSPYLFTQLELLRPRVICALGACAAQTLLGAQVAISRLRGKTQRWRGVPLICTFHPAYLLRNPSQKAASWQDLLEIRRLLEPEEV